MGARREKVIETPSVIGLITVLEGNRTEVDAKTLRQIKRTLGMEEEIDESSNAPAKRTQ